MIGHFTKVALTTPIWGPETGCCTNLSCRFHINCLGGQRPKGKVQGRETRATTVGPGGRSVHRHTTDT
jgi:hypothetical protein